MKENKLKQLFGENTTCDFKEFVERKQPKSWLKSVSAFANGMGGSLIFGVNDNGNIVGLNDVKGDIEFISDRIKTFIDPIPEFELLTKRIDNGCLILELHIIAGNMTPYYYINSGTRTAFIRIGDESVVTSSHQLSALVLKGRNRTYDSLVTEYRFGDMTFECLAKIYQKQTGLFFEQNLLQSFSLVTDEGLLTQAGVLFSDQCPYRHSSLYCTRWVGLDKDDALDSREYQGNLLALLDAGIQFITLYNKKGWIKLPNKRLDTPDYSDRAVFEALVNALIHRDYSVLGSEIHIDIYDDRLVIYSPGGMFDGSLIQNRNLNEVPSKRRNPILADVFTQFGYMEKRGSGLRKICNETAKLPGFSSDKKPLFRSQYESFFAEILNNNYEQIERNSDVAEDVVDVAEDVVDVAEDVVDVAEDVVDVVDVAEDVVDVVDVAEDVVDVAEDVVDVAEDVVDVAEKILLYIETDKYITTKELSEKLSISLRQIQRIMKRLKTENKVTRIGGDKVGHWEINRIIP